MDKTVHEDKVTASNSQKKLNIVSLSFFFFSLNILGGSKIFRTRSLCAELYFQKKGALLTQIQRKHFSGGSSVVQNNYLIVVKINVYIQTPSLLWGEAHAAGDGR